MPTVIHKRSLLKRSIAESRLKELRVGPPSGEQDLGSEWVWICVQSPIGVCVYHPPTDPGHYGACLFCGQPMERK
jgi:hypothetical protein